MISTNTFFELFYAFEGDFKLKGVQKCTWVIHNSYITKLNFCHFFIFTKTKPNSCFYILEFLDMFRKIVLAISQVNYSPQQWLQRNNAIINFKFVLNNLLSNLQTIKRHRIMAPNYWPSNNIAFHIKSRSESNVVWLATLPTSWHITFSKSTICLWKMIKLTDWLCSSTIDV